ncbi:MAG TPA: hypothetical protein VGX23_33580 [Actinocrinis sp.]|nr:hypothetical protein [Actinocrinis sp.]
MSLILHDSTISVTSAPCAPWCTRHDAFGDVCTGTQQRTARGEHAVILTRSPDEVGDRVYVSLDYQQSVSMDADEAIDLARIMIAQARKTKGLITGGDKVTWTDSGQHRHTGTVEHVYEGRTPEARIIETSNHGAVWHVDVDKLRRAPAETAALEVSAQPKTLADRIRHADSDECNEIHADLIDTYGRDCANALWAEAVREVEQNGEVA